MSSPVLDYFRKHQQLIRENLALSSNPLNVEAIHNFRLSVKRIRVVARLLDMLGKDSFRSKAMLGGVNSLFKCAGGLRDVQVIRQLLIQFNDPALRPIEEKSMKQENKRYRKFAASRNQFDVASLDRIDDWMVSNLEDLPEQQYISYSLRLLNEMETEVHNLYHGSSAENRLHKVRTRLKDINYLNNIFNESLPVHEHLHVGADRLREAGEIAGAWHDCLILELKLGKYMRKHPDLLDLPSIERILARVTEKKQDLFQEYSCILINEMRI